MGFNYFNKLPSFTASGDTVVVSAYSIGLLGLI